jgi:hypothetical protein
MSKPISKPKVKVKVKAKLFMGALAIILVVTALGAVWQHQRYLQVRRQILGDRQEFIYPGKTFHALTLVKVGPGRSLIDGLRSFRRLIESPGGGHVVYAGQVGVAAVTSKQLSNDWSGLLLTQFPSREAYDEYSARDEVRAGLARFDNTYTHGVVRPAAMNLALVQGLGLLRLADIVRRAPSSFPFVPAGDDARPEQKAKMQEMEQLDALRGVCENAVVIFNLIKPGNAEQRKADRSYARQMMSGMAEGGYGPMHMGRAVTIEGDASFEDFAAVYYPGINFVQQMIGSTFMSRIGGGKQLGDSLALITVPILSQL